MRIVLSQPLFYTWVEIGPQSLMIWVQSLCVWLWGDTYPLGHHVTCMPNCDWLWQVLYRMSHFGVSLCCFTVYWAFFVMALCELSYGNFHMPRRSVVTYEEVFAKTELRWVTRYERDGVPIWDILARRVFVDRFVQSSQLEVVINQIYIFSDRERENWTRWKSCYCRIEKNVGRNLYNAVIRIKNKIVWV